MKCEKCRGELDLVEKDTSSGSDMRTYRCAHCQKDYIVDFGIALWKVLSDARDTEE